ncbi:RDD family protein [Malonomonas rubra]|uniref:RDD family protein n=1 Tax=Malonomonas rubra TaxID=57040 RepID=UPI0026F0CB5C|nr:RDD family protein [Malonomonas rubra]
MRCPKCGYNSFDHLDSCKKCGKDLTEHKQKFGIVSVLFPGQMKPAGQIAAEEESIVEEVVAAATPAVAAAVAEGITRATAEDLSVTDKPAATETSERDEFGFDFMSDSEEDEDLSFDELFEEAPVDEDVEESLPSPEAEDEGDDEFSFDIGSTEESTDDASELEDDFGFDPRKEASEVRETVNSSRDNEGNLSFDSDTIEFEDNEEPGVAEDPKDPFDLPGSSPQEGAPEERVDLTIAEPEDERVVVAEDRDFQANLLVEEQADLGAVAADLSIDPLPSAAESGAAGLDSVASGIPGRVVEEPLTDQFSSNPLEEAENATVLVASGTAEIKLLPSIGNRVAAFCCDLFLLTVVGICFVLAAEAAISTSRNGLLPSFEILLDLSIPYFLVLFSLAFGYFTLFHFLAGQTPGKMLAGLRVETVAGEPLLFSQAFLRSVGGLLQFLPIGFGYLAILFSPDRRGWNDRLAGTRLISLRGLTEDV